MTDFKSLGLNDRLLERLAEQSLSEPTPIQAQAIPLVLAGRDVMGLAQTGTGKTAAFGLPMIQMLTDQRRRPAPRAVHALILAPTRELAKQIEAALGKFAQGTPTRITVVTGGASLNAQADRLAKGTDILVATPGRLIDLMDRRAVFLTDVRFLVLDEADHMLDMGFIHSLRKIAQVIPKARQTLLFSATMPKLMAEVAESYLRDAVRIEVSPAGKPVERIVQGVHFTTQGDKAKVLEDYLLGHKDERALVFARTKHGAEKLMNLLVSWGYDAASIHGNKSQNQRDKALAEFKAGVLKVLVATDVAARGIDIPKVGFIYNYDVPNVPENYVHRIGRTARAGRDGRAVTLCAPAELDELRAIEKTMKQAIPVLVDAAWVAGPAQPQTKARPQGRPARGGKPHGQKPAYGQGSGNRPQSAGGRADEAQAAKPRVVSGGASPSGEPSKPVGGKPGKWRGRRTGGRPEGRFAA
ncbi:MAG: DEAD/DEAH box helicase [Paracoccaceae bacterium]